MSEPTNFRIKILNSKVLTSTSVKNFTSMETIRDNFTD